MRRYPLLLAAILWLSACQQPAQKKSSTLLVDSVTTTGSSENHTGIKTIPPQKLIIAGKSVGETKLNEVMDSVIKKLGKPDAGDAAMGKALSVWYAKHDTTGYKTEVFSARQMGSANEAARVKEIRVTSPWFVTQEGLHAGSTLMEIKKHYSVEKTATFTEGKQQFIIYESAKGISFEVDPTNVCRGIAIWGTAPPAPGKTYLPLYKNLELPN